MGKKIDVAFDVPAPVEAVYAVISGEGWAAAKDEEFDDGSRQESRTEGDGGAVTLVVSRGLPEGIPGFLEKFLPKGGRARQTEAWGPAEGGARRGTWSGEIPGAPATVGGTMALEPTATGTRYVVKGEIKVHIPLVGGKAESFVADLIGKLLGNEAALLAKLAG
jgi:hypothetical protein